jgi:hypothetical protein
LIKWPSPVITTRRRERAVASEGRGGVRAGASWRGAGRTAAGWAWGCARGAVGRADGPPASPRPRCLKLCLLSSAALQTGYNGYSNRRTRIEDICVEVRSKRAAKRLSKKTQSIKQVESNRSSSPTKKVLLVNKVSHWRSFWQLSAAMERSLMHRFNCQCESEPEGVVVASSEQVQLYVFFSFVGPVARLESATTGARNEDFVRF